MSLTVGDPLESARNMGQPSCVLVGTCLGKGRVEIQTVRLLSHWDKKDEPTTLRSVSAITGWRRIGRVINMQAETTVLPRVSRRDTISPSTVGWRKVSQPSGHRLVDV